MKSIKEILEEKRKTAYKAKINNVIEPPTQEYLILKNKVDGINGNIQELIENADPLQIDSHEERRIVVNLEGFNNEKLENIRYLIQLIAYFNGNNPVKGHIVGMLANSGKCYLRDLFGNFGNKEISYNEAKKIFSSNP